MYFFLRQGARARASALFCGLCRQGKKATCFLTCTETGNCFFSLQTEYRKDFFCVYACERSQVITYDILISSSNCVGCMLFISLQEHSRVGNFGPAILLTCRVCHVPCTYYIHCRKWCDSEQDKKWQFCPLGQHKRG